MSVRESDALAIGFEISALDAVTGEAAGSEARLVDGSEPRMSPKVGDRFSAVGDPAEMTVVLGFAVGVWERSSVGKVAFFR